MKNSFKDEEVGLQQINERLKNIEEILINQKKDGMGNLWILIPVIVLIMAFLVKIFR